MSIVGGLFSSELAAQGLAPVSGGVDWSKQAGNAAPLDWGSIKPFQVIGPMSWAATNQNATAPEEIKKQLDAIPTTDTRSEYQKWLDSQNKGSRDGGGGMSREGGLAGNGTNFTDAQWATIKAMRDEVDPATGQMVGFNNPYDQAAMRVGVKGLMGVLSGDPLKLAAAAMAAQPDVRAQYDAIASFGGASNTGLLGQDFGTQAWSDAVNENAAARQAREQQSAAEAAAIAAAQQAAGSMGGGNYGSWSRGDAGGWGGATGGTDGSASFGGDRGTRGGF